MRALCPAALSQTMENCQVVPCWQSVLQQAGGWQERRAAADDFNSKVCGNATLHMCLLICQAAFGMGCRCSDELLLQV
jgi:hypothetical protein